ncbi:Integrase-type DNA-binding superfamily protein [Arabidopsis thaliana]|uniref:Integrase-type DNA-binding superfamily protein n=1 Tax=Arabidopsis thaliana TaxID=3702 RepID=A0A1P8B748_ARATH|nr:Integrase-type DNA-binding superfamily protein [Arabidopsis thaliana]ANM67418.1 Integrase-type DNA-binding superfamily protein [Arabidopsis thaliana]|eukprot:NP_001329250.1 Integrase-type DNA-binding superfamily protein [Arabidopsis thaliana]
MPEQLIIPGQQKRLQRLSWRKRLLKKEAEELGQNICISDQPPKRRKQHRRKRVHNQEPCLMRGVYYKNMKWQAAIKVEKKQIHLGTFSSQEEAARLYDRAAFMCGREPNFELSEEVIRELKQQSWEEFLNCTRRTITNKSKVLLTTNCSVFCLITFCWTLWICRTKE